VPPPPTQAGLIAHFQAIHEAVGIPIILYDVPSRTACPMADVTIKRGIAKLNGAKRGSKP
jgi:dihydrodipicolinate synthase/N-acetylneuraminate lyase